jgi:polar amino acid transport system substrate-binding protein
MRGTRTLLVAGLVALIAAALFAMGCGSSDDESSTSANTSGSSQDLGLINDGELLVGTDAPYPPFEIGTPEEGNFAGFDKDVMDEIANRLGLTPTYQNSSFDTIFRDVAAGQFDIVAAAATITPAREKVVDFSDPYYEAQQALVVPVDSDIQSTDDLSGQIVGAQQGTTGETYAQDKTDAKEVRGFQKGADALAAVTTGQVAAAIVDQPFAADAIEKGSGDIEIAQEISTNELYGFPTAPGAPLHDAVNEQLAAMKEDGTLNDIYQKYFHTDAPDTVINGTTKNTG